MAIALSPGDNGLLENLPVNPYAKSILAKVMDCENSGQRLIGSTMEVIVRIPEAARAPFFLSQISRILEVKVELNLLSCRSLPPPPRFASS